MEGGEERKDTSAGLGCAVGDSQTSQLQLVVEALYLHEPVALQPDALQPSVLLQSLNTWVPCSHPRAILIQNAP